MPARAAGTMRDDDLNERLIARSAARHGRHRPDMVSRTAGNKAAVVRKEAACDSFMRRRSTIALLMCLPLILIIAGLVVYPAFYSIYLSMLNKAQTRFIGLGNFRFLLSRDVFWMVVQQTAIFACSAVFFKALIGLVTAHLINNLPGKGQRKWRGMLLVPWVIPLALSSLGWWWLFDPTHSAFNWIVSELGYNKIPWLSDPYWARFSVILVNVWYGAPFFLIMYLAALKSVPEQLYEAAAIDGANAWQKFRHITLPMMRNIIAITVLFSLIVTFANFDIVQIMTARWTAQYDARVRDLRLHARHPLRRFAARRRHLAVHVPHPRRRGDFHPARRPQARPGNRMSTAALPLRAGRGFGLHASLRRNRRWALITSYVFLVVFAIFFLIPPYYMVVTSLKSDAEVARMATNPWIVADGFTLDQFRILLTQTDFLIFFKNTVIVTLCVVADHHGGQRACRLFARPDEILGFEHPGDRHFSDLPRSRHALVHPAIPDRQSAADCSTPTGAWCWSIPR